MIASTAKIEALVASALRAARVPGAALAVIQGSQVLLAAGYGYRDLATKLPVTPTTMYPIASTTKAMNSTLLGILVDEGKLKWDGRVQYYLPQFSLSDPLSSPLVTVRDLIVMRTGLPRHDFVWDGKVMTRAELVERLSYLELSAGFREKYQYNNITVTVAGHVAEAITGTMWEELVQEKLLDPLGMDQTVFTRPATGNVTESYHENYLRQLIATMYVPGEVTAPSGGAMYSTVVDMARWLLFNLQKGAWHKQRLVAPSTFAELHSPQILIGEDPSAPSPGAAYALGWFVDTYNGYLRVLHGGYLHDVHSDVMLFPAQEIGIVSFTNFGCPGLSRVINQNVFDLLMGLASPHTVQQKLALYERRIEENRARINAAVRVRQGSPPRPRDCYVGVYVHPGYGSVQIYDKAGRLFLRIGSWDPPLVHWHDEIWAFAENDLFEIHKEHAFDTTSRLRFDVGEDGAVAGLSVQLEPAVAPIRFAKLRCAL